MKIYKRPGLLLLVFYLTISAVWGQKNVKGSGYVLTQQRETADFTSIETVSYTHLTLPTKHAV